MFEKILFKTPLSNHQSTGEITIQQKVSTTTRQSVQWNYSKNAL